MAIVNFDSAPRVDHSSLEATYDGWTFGYTYDDPDSVTLGIANLNFSERPNILNQSGGRSIIINHPGSGFVEFFFASADSSDFQFNSFKLAVANATGSTSVYISAYRDGGLVVDEEFVDLTDSDSDDNITYTLQGQYGGDARYGGLLTFNSAFDNILITYSFASSALLLYQPLTILFLTQPQSLPPHTMPIPIHCSLPVQTW